LTLAAAAGACLALGFFLSAPREPPSEKAAARNAGQAIAFALRPGVAEARAIIEQNCVGCHEAAPVHPGLAHAAAGLDFAAPGAVEKYRAEILRAAVFSRAMPPPGAAKPLDEDERLLLLRWAESRN
jgi:uncharacterized membrane protein